MDRSAKLRSGPNRETIRYRPAAAITLLRGTRTNSSAEQERRHESAHLSNPSAQIVIVVVAVVLLLVVVANDRRSQAKIGSNPEKSKLSATSAQNRALKSSPRNVSGCIS